MRHLAVVFCCLFLFISCEKDSEELISNEVNSKLEKSPANQIKAGKPDQPGNNMKVFRYEGAYQFIITDVKENMIAIIGFDVESLCNGTGANNDPVDIQDILLNEGTNGDAPRFNQTIKGKDVQVSIWPIGDIVCSTFLDNEPIFEGTGDYVFNDNDALAYDRDGKNSNSFGLNLKGDGIKIVWHSVWDGNDEATLHEVVKITIK